MNNNKEMLYTYSIPLIRSMINGLKAILLVIEHPEEIPIQKREEICNNVTEIIKYSEQILAKLEFLQSVEHQNKNPRWHD